MRPLFWWHDVQVHFYHLLSLLHDKQWILFKSPAIHPPVSWSGDVDARDELMGSTSCQDCVTPLPRPPPSWPPGAPGALNWAVPGSIRPFLRPSYAALWCRGILMNKHEDQREVKTRELAGGRILPSWVVAEWKGTGGPLEVINYLSYRLSYRKCPSSIITFWSLWMGLPIFLRLKCIDRGFCSNRK